MTYNEDMAELLTEHFNSETIDETKEIEEQIFQALTKAYPLVERHQALNKGEYRYRICTVMNPFAGYEATVKIRVENSKIKFKQFIKYHNS